MRAAIIADVHLGNHGVMGGPVLAGVNLRCRQTLEVYAAAHKASSMKVQADVTIIAGDMFDTHNTIPQVVSGAIAATPTDPPTWVLCGNHEQQSTADGDNSVHVMSHVSGIVVDDKPRVRVFGGPNGRGLVVGVPYYPAPVHTWLEDAIREAMAGWMMELEADPGRRPIDPDVPVLLVGHFGVEDARTVPWLRGAHDSIKLAELAKICRATGVSGVAVGNWHDHRKWTLDGGGLEIVQVGALVPTGWDNPSRPAGMGNDDVYGSVIEWDTDARVGSRLSRHVVPGPRFFATASMADVETVARMKQVFPDYVPYVRFTTTADQLSDARDRIAALGIDHYALDVSDEDVGERIAQAAQAASSHETTDRAISEYTAAAYRGTDIDPAAVARLCKGYVAGSRATWT